MDVVGVVPIFMSAGAAVLPTLVAGATSVAAVLLKPREMLRICRERPIVVASVVVVVVAASIGIWLWTGDSPAQTAKAGVPHAPIQYDWAKVAENLIVQENIRAAQERARVTQEKIRIAHERIRIAQDRFRFIVNPGQVATAAPTTEKSTEPIVAKVPPPSPIVVGGDFARCSYAGGPSPLDLQRMWSYQPENTMFFSVPVVSGKRIFTAGCVIDGGGFLGLLACLDSETGKPLWEITNVDGDPLQQFKPFYSSPAMTADGKYLVIGGGLHEDRNCSLRCFNANSGEQHWAVKTSLHIESSPAIFGDVAVVGCGAIEGTDGKATGDPGHVLAVRISDGKELWRVPVNDPESSPAIDGEGVVYIGSGFNGNAIVALRIGSDDELREKKLERIIWRTPVARPATSTITVAGDLVIAGAGSNDFLSKNPPDGFVVALDRKTGQVRWQTKFADSVLSQIAFRDGKLICPVRTGEVAALDVTDGHMLWHTPISGKAPVLAGCAFTGKRIYAVTSDGYLAIMDPKNGNVDTKILLNDEAKAGDGRCYCSPQVVNDGANGRVIVGSETGGLRCYVGLRSAE